MHFYDIDNNVQRSLNPAVDNVNLDSITTKCTLMKSIIYVLSIDLSCKYKWIHGHGNPLEIKSFFPDIFITSLSR